MNNKSINIESSFLFADYEYYKECEHFEQKGSA